MDAGPMVISWVVGGGEHGCGYLSEIIAWERSREKKVVLDCTYHGLCTCVNSLFLYL